MSININALLDEGSALVSTLYLDTLLITRDVKGRADATMDRVTGLVSQPAPLQVYSGPGKIRPSNRVPGADGDAGKANSISTYECSVPLSSAPVQIGDYVECIASQRDPALVGLKALVTSAQGNTLAVQRKFTADSATNVRRIRP